MFTSFTFFHLIDHNLIKPPQVLIPKHTPSITNIPHILLNALPILALFPLAHKHLHTPTEPHITALLLTQPQHLTVLDHVLDQSQEGPVPGEDVCLCLFDGLG